MIHCLRFLITAIITNLKFWTHQLTTQRFMSIVEYIPCCSVKCGQWLRERGFRSHNLWHVNFGSRVGKCVELNGHTKIVFHVRKVHWTVNETSQNLNPKRDKHMSHVTHKRHKQTMQWYVTVWRKLHWSRALSKPSQTRSGPNIPAAANGKGKFFLTWIFCKTFHGYLFH